MAFIAFIVVLSIGVVTDDTINAEPLPEIVLVDEEPRT